MRNRCRRSFGFVLAAADGKLNQKEIAKLLVTDENTLVDRIDDLTKKGFIQRVRNEEDRRQNLIVLTSKTSDTVREWEKIAKNAYFKICSPLSASELNTLHKMCIHLIHSEYE